MQACVTLLLWLRILKFHIFLFFFELDFVVNRNKRRHTRHDAKHTIAPCSFFFL